MQRTASVTAATLATTLLATGCTLFGPPTDPGGGEPGGDVSDPPVSAPPDGFVREGFIGTWGEYLNARIEVTELATVDGMTRLTIEYTNLEDRTIELGAYDNPMSAHWFRILDPVRQLRYSPHPDIGADISDFYREELWQPGVTYELVVFYPELKGDPDRLTVEAPGGIGEFAGVPVTSGEPRDDPSGLPEEREEGWPAEGETVTVPVDDGPPEEQGTVNEVVSQVETVVSGRESDSEQETVALRADVLFEFDESALTPDAENILADVIEETRERADPEKPPITVTGHTDGVGSDDYNQTLSEERAEAVRAVLEAELGADYTYEAEGAGSTDPAETEGGEDDSWARAQNRRVEISYSFREDVVTEEPGDGETEVDTLEIDPADAGEPAGFRTVEGVEPVATATAEQEYFYGGDLRHSWELEVYPFYRDGAFVVGRFEATHEGDPVPSTVNPFGTDGHFEFSAFDPTTGVVYPQVFNGADMSFVDRVGSRLWPAGLASGSTQYGYVYLTAPPEGTTELTFDAGIFGTLPNIPIEGA